MSIEQRIHSIMTQHFGAEAYILTNQSHKHAGHSGDDGSGETHFHLEIKSDAFKSMSRIEAQRYVYKLLDKEFTDGLHALALKIKKV